MKQPPFDNLPDWLTWQESLHPREIDLGLDRVRVVADALSVMQTNAFVILVGGTNGKGSSVMMLSSAFMASGYTTACYTSPHLLRYNERVTINDEPCTDADFCMAFSAVESARNGVSLTYFEYGTLAALWLMKRKKVDVMILEVGLGGRLDAVNIMDADVALVTNIGLDHCDWLGPDRDSIGREKAGIYRAGQNAVYNDLQPVNGLLDVAVSTGCVLHVLNQNYEFEVQENGWSWRSDCLQIVDIALHKAPAHQVLNAAGVLKCLQLAANDLNLDLDKCARGLLAQLPHGRGQWMKISCNDICVDVLFDVSHNTEAVEALASQLASNDCSGKTYAVFSAMRDKPIEALAEKMAPCVDEWFVAGLDLPRASTGQMLVDRLSTANIVVHESINIVTAWETVLSKVTSVDRVVVFGSFFTVEAILKVI